MAGASLFGTVPGPSSMRRSLASLLSLNPDNDHVLVAIFLNGGNDSLNTVVQLDDLSALSTLRQHVFLPESSLLKLPDVPLALHPSLSGLRGLYEQGKLRIVRAVGYADQNFSHFRSTDIWMSGADADQVVASGWMGRYLNNTYPGYPSDYPNPQVPHPLALELGFSNSLLFQGPLSNMSVVINGERDYYQLVNDNEGPTPSTLTGRQLAHVKLVRRQSQVYGQEIIKADNQAGSQLSYPDTEIAGQLRIVARMIAGGLKTPMYKVEIGGFDTHAGQVDPGDKTQGVHADLLRQLDEAIVAFQNDLEHLGVADRVLGMTFSEFGRRIVSNASDGTDHGSAAPLFVFGTYVESGILGENYQLDPAMTYEDNLPYQYDFRQIYGSMLEQWLCVPTGDVDAALLGTFDSIPLVQPGACTMTSTRDEDARAARSWIQVHPNPLNGLANVVFRSLGEDVHVDLIAADGRLVRSLVRGRYPKGEHTVAVETSDLIPGNYFVQIQSRQFRQARPVVKL